MQVVALYLGICGFYTGCIRVGFPDAESDSNAIACVLSVVKQYKLVGRWVTSRIKQRREGVCEDQRDSPCEFLACFLY